jgi:hypothetical protein
MEDKRFYVYIWIRLDKNEVFYVGKGTGNRYKDMSMRNRYFLNVVNKIGKENIEIKIVEDNLLEDEAFEREKFYIKYYNDQGFNLTNLTSGGEGSSDWYRYLTEEEKEKHKEISKSFIGKHHTEKTKQKMSQSMKGLKHSFSEKGLNSLRESIQNRESYWKGKHLSEETKKKISETRKERKISNPNQKPVYILDENLNIIEELPNRTYAMSVYGYKVKTYVKLNKNIGHINELHICNNKCFIYKEDYDLLMSQSTIEMITSNEVDAKTE